MAANRFTLYAVKLGSTVVPGTSSQQFSFNGETMVPITDGGPDPTVASLSKAAPAVEFTTLAIVEAVTALGLLGKDIADLTGGVVLYFRLAGRVGSTAGSTHTTKTCTAGVIAPSRLTAEHEGQPASISFKVQAVSSDGTTAPWTTATSAALDTIASALAKIFRVGPIKLDGGSVQDGIKGIDIDFGTKIETDSDSGYAYPTAAWLSERKPKATIKHTDVAFAVPTSFTSAVLFLRALVNGGFPYANADEHHYKITFAAGVYVEGDRSASPTAECSFMIEGRKTGSTDIVQGAALQAIA